MTLLNQTGSNTWFLDKDYLTSLIIYPHMNNIYKHTITWSTNLKTLEDSLFQTYSPVHNYNSFNISDSLSQWIVFGRFFVIISSLFSLDWNNYISMILSLIYCLKNDNECQYVSFSLQLDFLKWISLLCYLHVI